MGKIAFILQFEEHARTRSHVVGKEAYNDAAQMCLPGALGVTHIYTNTGGTNDVDTDND